MKYILVEKRRLARDPLASFPLLFTQREAHARKKCHLVGKRKLSTKRKGDTQKRAWRGKALCCFLLQNKSWCVFALYRQKEKEISERRFSQTIKSISIWKKKVNVFSCGRKKNEKILFKKGQYQLEIWFPAESTEYMTVVKNSGGEKKNQRKQTGAWQSSSLLFIFL